MHSCRPGTTCLFWLPAEYSPAILVVLPPGTPSKSVHWTTGVTNKTHFESHVHYPPKLWSKTFASAQVWLLWLLKFPPRISQVLSVKKITVEKLGFLYSALQTNSKFYFEDGKFGAHCLYLLPMKRTKLVLTHNSQHKTTVNTDFLNNFVGTCGEFALQTLQNILMKLWHVKWSSSPCALNVHCKYTNFS